MTKKESLALDIAIKTLERHDQNMGIETALNQIKVLVPEYFKKNEIVYGVHSGGY